MEGILRGFINYKNSEYPFLYQDGILNIIPGSIDIWMKENDELFDKIMNCNSHNLEWIKQEDIRGNLNNGKKVIFSVKGQESNDNGFMTFDVVSIFIYDDNVIDENKIGGIRIYGDEIDYFLSPGRIYETTIEFNDSSRMKGLNITSKNIEVLDCGKYIYKGVDITIQIEIIATANMRSHNPTTSRTQLKLDFSKEVEIEFAYEIINDCSKFFKYVCSRTNINLNKYDVLDIDKRKGGNIYFINNIIPESHKKKEKVIIGYDYLKQKTAKLFESISNNEMYYSHLQSSIESRNKYEISRIISIMVAFEREFRNIYSSIYKRSELFYDTRDEVISELENLRQQNSGDKKKYINSFIKTISKSENSFSDKLKFAIRENFDVLKEFFVYDYGNAHNYQELSKNNFELLINNIGSDMNKLRNDSAHGNIDLEVRPIDLRHLNTIENLLIAMRLKEISVLDLDIKKSIADINRYNIVIQGKS